MRYFTSIAALATLALSTVHAASLQASITGSNFLNYFDFQAISDPTHGRVNYVDQGTAQSRGLVSLSGSSITLRTDSTTKLTWDGPGRNSIRVRSKQQYSNHILVADIRHMPEGLATWPALWETKEDGWPSAGEIDIIEGVNNVSPNAATLHTTSGCTMPSSRQMSGSPTQLDCNYQVNGNAGCGVKVSQGGSFGPDFNRQGGGHYVMQRTSSFIKVWFFPRGQAPSDISSGAQNVNPSGWGTPFAYFGNEQCNFPSHFGAMNIIINLTFCGDWAGPAFVGPNGASGMDSCKGYVNDAPSAFANAYWDIAALRIYNE